MTKPTRRALTIDDPVAGRDACRVARSGGTDVSPGQVQHLQLDQVRPNPSQPRKQFDAAALAGLADSIRERGVLQPIIVRPVQDGAFEIVAGERRWRAARQAGQSAIPALIEASLDGADSLELALIENVVREDLTPIEEARTIAVLLDDLQLTAAALARRLGRSRADVAHTVRLLDLPDLAIDLIDTGALTKGHGKTLLSEPDHDRRRALARRAAEAGWSVRALESEIARGGPARTTPERPHPDHEATAARLEDALTKAIGCEARARPHRDGYQVILDRAAGEQLIRVFGTTDTGV
ncbi:MAG: ParB/RepB/Spo0J family partition protein [Solirubrobacteraceae bacterium]